MRSICATWLVAHPQQIGGVGIIVEIDESLIAKVAGSHSQLNIIWILNKSYLNDLNLNEILISEEVPCGPSSQTALGLRRRLSAWTWLLAGSPQ